jgi:hypothetical protein
MYLIMKKKHSFTCCVIHSCALMFKQRSFVREKHYDEHQQQHIIRNYNILRDCHWSYSNTDYVYMSKIVNLTYL